MVKITEAFKEFHFLFGKQRETQKIMTGTFSFSITKAKWINSFPEIMARFIFIQVANSAYLKV